MFKKHYKLLMQVYVTCPGDTGLRISGRTRELLADQTSVRLVLLEDNTLSLAGETIAALSADGTGTCAVLSCAVATVDFWQPINE